MKCKDCSQFVRFKQDGKDNFGLCEFIHIADSIEYIQKGGLAVIGDRESQVIFEENFGCDRIEPYKEIRKEVLQHG